MNLLKWGDSSLSDDQLASGSENDAVSGDETDSRKTSLGWRLRIAGFNGRFVAAFLEHSQGAQFGTQSHARNPHPLGRLKLVAVEKSHDFVQHVPVDFLNGVP